jgi:DNA-binding NarL/FixJ family response regulator
MSAHSGVQLVQNHAVEHLRDTRHWCLGLDGKWRPNSRFDTTQRDRQIVLLRSSGKSIRAIGTEVGCSVGTVHRVLAQWVVVDG